MSDIELVIKMPEKVYNHILSMQFCLGGLRNGKSLLEEILKAIRTGTPLPKGHGRLIDFDALDKDFDKCNCSGDCGFLICPVYSQKVIIEADKESEEE